MKKNTILSFLLIAGALTSCSNNNPVVSFSKKTQSAAESVGTLKATIVLTETLDKDVTVPVTVTGTATSDDYTITESPITIAAGKTSADITITLVDDGKSESNETVILTMGKPTNAEKGKITKDTVTISDTGAEDHVNARWINSEGDIYIADTYNCVIRKVDHSTGYISTVAGTGDTCGDSGDGGAATSAELNYPTAVTLDSDENMYIADTSNCKIKKVDANTGIISTIAGDGVCAYAGDGAAATSAQMNDPLDLLVTRDGDVIFSDINNHRVRIITVDDGKIDTIVGVGTSNSTGNGGLATAAEIRYPYALALDSSDNLYVSESSQIRKVNATTGIITTVVGTGTYGNTGDGGLATAAEIRSPFGILVDQDDNIFISDSFADIVRKVTASDGNINTFAGTSTGGYSGDAGDALSAELDGPDRIDVGPDGNIYFYEGYNNVVRKVDTTTNFISTVAGTGVGDYTGDGAAATAATLDNPGGGYWWD